MTHRRHRTAAAAIAAALMTAAPLAAHAQHTLSLEVAEAGTLSTLVTDGQKYTTDTLTLKGELNGDDILLLREMSGRDIASQATEGRLLWLDLSGASIVAGGGCYYQQNQYNKAATADGVLGEHTFEQSTLTHVVLPSTLTAIRGGAFSGSTALESVSIPEGVTAIGAQAFMGCTALTEMTFPDVTAIGDEVLEGCTALKSVTFPATTTSVGYMALYGCSALEQLHCLATAVPAAGYWAFKGVDTEKCRLSVPFQSTSAYAQADGWKDFTDITYEPGTKPIDPVRTVGVTEPGTLASLITDEEKYGIRRLTVTGDLNGDDIVLLRDMAGRDDEGMPTAGTLDTLDLSGARIVTGGSYYILWYTVEHYTQDDILSHYIFDGTTLRHIDLPATTTIIQGGAFSDCYSLEGTVTIPEGVTRIGEYAFSSCSSVEHFVLPSTLREGTGTEFLKSALGNDAFYGCHALKDITVPDGVEEIRGYTFADCFDLTEADLPASVRAIDSWAFRGDSALVTLRMRAAVPPTLNYQAFDDAHPAQVTVHVPSDCGDAYRAAAGWKDFTIVEDLPSAIGTTAAGNAQPRIAAVQGGVRVTAGEATPVTVHDAAGRTVATAASGTGTIRLPKGLYVVRAGRVTAKVAVR